MKAGQIDRNLKNRARKHGACVGTILLDLRNALRRADKCRRALTRLGYSQQRWQEIVNDVEPELKFLVRPKVLDAITIYLRSKRRPVEKNLLIREIGARGGRSIQRIRQAITTNLRSGKLILFNGDRIGLPEWKK